MYRVSEEYKQDIYSGDNDNEIKITYDGVEVENAPLLTTYLKWQRRIFNYGSKVFQLGNFVSQLIELAIYNFNVEDTSKEFFIEIGRKINGEYEYVPLGYYHIKENPSNVSGKTTYKLVDRSTKFDKNVDISPLMEANNGKVTKLQAVQEYCQQCGVEFANESFIGSNKETGVYDNKITARQHIIYIAESAGCIATIGRDGKLYFIPLVPANNDNTIEIPERILNNNMTNSKSTYTISKVVYEGALMPYETGDDSYDSVFIDTANPYITEQDDIDSIYNQIRGLRIDNIKTSNIIGDPSIDPWDYIQYTHTDDEGNPIGTYTSLGQYDYEFNGVNKQSFETEIDREKKKVNSTTNSDVAKINRLKQEIDTVDASLKVTAEQASDNTSRISQLAINVSSIQNLFQITGGNNLIKNSAFLLNDEVWTFEDEEENAYHTPIGQGYNSSLIGSTVSLGEIKLKNTILTSNDKNIENLKTGQSYTLNYSYKQDDNTTTIVSLINKTTGNAIYEKTYDEEQESLENETIEFVASDTDYIFRIETTTTLNGYFYLYDLMLNSGDKKSWEPAIGEVYSTVLQMSRNGFQVFSSGSNMLTLITSDGFQIRKATKSGGQIILGDVIHEFTERWLNSNEILTNKITIGKYINAEININSVIHHIEYIGN